MSKYSRCGGVYSYDNSEDNTQGDRGRRNKSQGDRGGSNTYGDRLTAGRNNFVQTGSNPLQYDPFRGFRKKYGVPIRGRKYYICLVWVCWYIDCFFLLYSLQDRLI